MSKRTSTEVQTRVSVSQDQSARQQPHETFDVDDSNAAQTDDVVYPTGLKLWSSMAAILMVALAKRLDLTAVAVTVPSLTNAFKTLNDIGWYSAAVNLSLSAFTFFLPLKQVFVTSIITFTLGILLCTVAPTSAVFILGRATAGLGSAGIGNGAVTILTRLFPLQKRPLWLGICGGVQSVALVSAPVIGGALIDSFSWRAAFGINLPLCAASIILITFGFNDPAPPRPESQLTFREKLKQLDLLGTLIIIPCIICLLLALQWGGTRHGWNPPLIISLLVTFAVLHALFIFLQYKFGDNATLPPRILKNRSILAGTWFQACCDGTLAMTEYYLAIYFQGVRGLTATESGALGLPMIIGLMIATLLAGAGTSAFGYYTPFMLTSTLTAPIPAGLLTTLSLHSSLPKILACLGALGAAIGLGIQAPFSACQTVLSPKDIPIGNAILTFGGAFGSSLFISASSALFQNRLVEELAQSAPAANLTRLEGVGLNDIRRVVRPERLRNVLFGYDEAASQTLYFPVALTVLGLVGCLGMEWRSVKEKRS